MTQNTAPDRSADAPGDSASHWFSPSYAVARQRFLAAAGPAVESHVAPVLGREGETLALDVLRLGPPDAERLLILSSACHGVEGHCGSGGQLALLHDADFLRAATDAGVALLFLHALNPWGYSHDRRVTQEGCDLNRNFLDFSQALPDNPGYDELAPDLLPPRWPPAPEHEARLAAWAERHGARAQQAAISQGQHRHPLGLFYSGIEPTWSHRTIRQVLRQHGQACGHLSWIDLHTGLGPCGVGERIFAGLGSDRAGLARARSWWGEGVTCVDDGESASTPLNGLMWCSSWQECPQAQITGMALEFGTLPLPEMLLALRGDHWLALHPEADPSLAAELRARMRAAYYVETPAWKADILRQTRQTAFEAVQGLATSGGA